MTPEQVPDELVELAKKAPLYYDRIEQRVAWGAYQRAILAAVLPAHEQRVREQVAKEIEQALDTDGDGSSWDGGMATAVEIARGAR